MPRITDRAAVRIALLIAIDSERAMIDAYANQVDRDTAEGVILARRNIAAFERVLDRYYDGYRGKRISGGRRMSMSEVLKMEPRKFDPMKASCGNQ